MKQLEKRPGECLRMARAPKAKKTGKEFLARTRSARLPTAMLFFCCHKCHTRDEMVTKKWGQIDKSGGRVSVFCIAKILRFGVGKLPIC